jgi:ABC-type multidrug transport system ATPase subunit
MLLQIDHLRLSLGGTPILRDVHLELEAREIYGLLGPNGAGKSTTIAAALGLLRPDAGRITMFGRKLENHTSSLRRRLGVLPEQNGFYDWMSAEDYLGFYASLYGKRLTPSEIAARFSKVGLAPRAGQLIGTFSQGMRQRLGLARALIDDPDLIILDETTLQLSYASRATPTQYSRYVSGNCPRNACHRRCVDDLHNDRLPLSLLYIEAASSGLKFSAVSFDSPP